MTMLLQAACFFCITLGGPPAPQLSQRAGDIWYTYEKLGRSSHLLRLSTTDFIIDADRHRDDRLAAFAKQFAHEICRARFSVTMADRRSWPVVRPVYARQYIVRCK